VINLVRTSTSILLLLAMSPVVFAQSGRRSSKPPQAPTAVSAPVDPPKPALAQTNTSKVKVLIARQSSKKHQASEDAIYATMIQHLNQFPDVSVTAIGDLKTDQAVKRAQQEVETYVVVVQFEIDIYQNGKLVLNSQNLEVSSNVYVPKTGERKFKEKTYYQPMGRLGSRTSGSPGGVPVKMTAEAAGISVAEQIRNGVLLVMREQSPNLKLP
jgi:hypothetical protein